jgi:RND family efflux transporter MFP subunit
VLVEEGTAVRQGTTLARLDDRELAAQLRAAEASFQVTKAAYDRAEQLRDRKVITIPEYERDRTAYEAARAQYDQLRTRIGYATVRAPVAGVVTEKSVEAGDVVSTNARLFAIADISTLVVRLGVSELDVVELEEGDPVRLNLDAYPDRELRGRIRRVFPSGDPTTRLVPVEVQLDPTSAPHARPGFLARATFALATHDGVLLVPQSAIVGAQGNEAVFIVNEGQAVRRTVETGLTSLGQVEIRSGLQEGEQIVTVGSNTLRDGMSVRAVSSGAAAPAETEARNAADGAPVGAAEPQRGGAR